MPLRIQYCSDLHYEFKPAQQIPKLLKDVKADVLVLAGDICAITDPKDWDKFVLLINHYAKKYKYIIHVAGNHEYYNVSKSIKKDDCFDEINTRFKNFMKIVPNYIYLDANIIILDINNKKYMFAGATLWTKIKPEDTSYIQNLMNDYSSIYICNKDTISKYTVEYMQKIHAKHVAFFKKAIKKATELNLPMIMITHHKPLANTVTPSRVTQAYEVDMSKIIKHPVAVSISGHTHVYLDETVNNIRYVSNPKGYPSQRCNFKENAYVDIP